MSWDTEIINEAFIDLAVIQPGEVISIASSIWLDARARLNQLLSSLSTEGATVYTQTIASYALTAGQAAYTFGSAGTWNAGARQQKIVAWKATSGLFASGGRALSFAEFDAAASAAYQQFQQVAAQVVSMQADLAAKVQAAVAPFYQVPVFAFPAIALASANVPMILGADTAWPLINARVFPAPVASGSIEITSWTPLAQIADFTAAPSLPDGWADMLHYNLAVRLYPQYARAGGIPPELAANAQNTKASIIQQNQMGQTPQAAQ